MWVDSANYGYVRPIYHESCRVEYENVSAKALKSVRSFFHRLIMTAGSEL